MAEKKPDPATNAINLGLYGRRGETGISAAEIIAIVLTVLWCGGVGAFLLLGGASGAAGVDSFGFVMRLLAIFLPVAVIWVGALAVRSARVMHAEASRLQAAIDALRQTYVAQAQAGAMAVQPSLTAKLDQIATTQKNTQSAIATFSSHRQRAAAMRPAAPIPPAAR